MFTRYFCGSWQFQAQFCIWETALPYRIVLIHIHIRYIWRVSWYVVAQRAHEMHFECDSLLFVCQHCLVKFQSCGSFSIVWNFSILYRKHFALDHLTLEIAVKLNIKKCGVNKTSCGRFYVIWLGNFRFLYVEDLEMQFIYYSKVMDDFIFIKMFSELIR